LLNEHTKVDTTRNTLLLRFRMYFLLHSARLINNVVSKKRVWLYINRPYIARRRLSH